MTQEEKDQLRKMGEHYASDPLGGIVTLLLNEVERLEVELKLKDISLKTANANTMKLYALVDKNGNFLRRPKHKYGGTGRAPGTAKIYMRLQDAENMLKGETEGSHIIVFVPEALE